MQDKFGDLFKLFLLINPEDDKPVAVVVPRRTLQPDSTGSLLAILLLVHCCESFILNGVKISKISFCMISKCSSS